VLAIERASRAATEPVGTLISTAPPKILQPVHFVADLAAREEHRNVRAVLFLTHIRRATVLLGQEKEFGACRDFAHLAIALCRLHEHFQRDIAPAIWATLAYHPTRHRRISALGLKFTLAIVGTLWTLATRNRASAAS
jgi:hypothetical protein